VFLFIDINTSRTYAGNEYNAECNEYRAALHCVSFFPANEALKQNKNCDLIKSTNLHDMSVTKQS